MKSWNRSATGYVFGANKACNGPSVRLTRGLAGRMLVLISAWLVVAGLPQSGLAQTAVQKYQKANQKKNQQLKQVDQKQQKIQKARKGKAKLGEDHQEKRPDVEDDSAFSGYKLPFGLPSWDAPDFEPYLEPLFGNQFSSAFKGDQQIHSGDVEAGAQVEFKGIPIVPVGVGLFANAKVGFTRGAHADVSTPKTLDPNNAYTPTTATRGNLRTWAGGDLDLLFDSLRLLVGLEQAKISFDSIAKEGIAEEHLNSREFRLGTGVRVMGDLSSWYSFRNYKAYVDNSAEPIVKENDHYFHLVFKLDYWDFDFDLGIGVSEISVYTMKPTAGGDVARFRVAKGISRTFRNLVKFSPAEGWDNEFYMKYSFNADDGVATAYNAIRLPSQPLNHPNIINGTPEDYFNLWFFSGAKDWVEGLTLGFAFGLNIENLTDKAKGQKTDRFGGPIVEYAYEF